MSELTANADVDGICDPRFAGVRHEFTSNFAAFGEVGAAVAIALDGRLVVDLWGGHADAARTRPWERNTIVNVYSSTKGVTATAAAILAGRGLLDYDARVSDYWPEFARAGKNDVLVRYLFDHRVGLPHFAAGTTMHTMFDWTGAVRVLQAQEPIWKPGSETGYHAFTFGWLTGEVLRRVTGVSVGTFVRRDIAGPLGVDFSIGTAAADEPRIAEMVLPVRPSDLPPPGAGALPDYAIDLHQQAIAAVNTPQFRRAELPAANGHANARSLARIYGVLACGGADGRTRIVDADVVAQLSIESASGYDAILSRDVRRSLGFNLATLGGRANYGPNPRTFGHGGAGGSLGFADPDARIGFGYTMNQMRLDPASDPRWSRLIDALYASL